MDVLEKTTQPLLSRAGRCACNRNTLKSLDGLWLWVF